MASTIPGLETYAGIIPDTKIPVLFEMLGIPIVMEGALMRNRYGVGGPVERQNYNTQRTLLVEKILELGAQTLVETQILRLIDEWLELPSAGKIVPGSSKEQGHEMSVAEARESIRGRLFAYYGFYFVNWMGGNRSLPMQR